MTIDLSQLAWVMYVLILAGVFFFVIYLVRILKETLPILKNLNITLQKTNVMLDDVQAIVGDAKEMTDDVTNKYQQLNEILEQVVGQFGGLFSGFFAKEAKTEKADIVDTTDVDSDSKGSM